MQRGFRIPARVSAGGGCQLYDARDGVIALNLARSDDRSLLPALFGSDAFDFDDKGTIAKLIARSHALDLVDQGRELGLAIAAENEPPPSIGACETLAAGSTRKTSRLRPRVLDLTAVWAGPLAGHLLALAEAEVLKIESTIRPDRMREGDHALYALLNRGKPQLSLDLTEEQDRRRLLELVRKVDIVLESSRPRALAQLGIDAEALVAANPGLIWMTITAHGARGDAAKWVGFGDDCAVAAGLSAAFREATRKSGFVGDAIGDPLAGIRTALEAWTAWQRGTGARIGIAMRGVVADAMNASAGLATSLQAWGTSEGQPFHEVGRRTPLAARALPEWATC